PYNQDSKNPLFIQAVKLKFKDLDIFGNNRVPIESKF
ncbi:polysaccharide deacetylase family protein, partial [Campylobacter coli]|nr:polysaccharide deacetylase family protein [Campylobacter coli]